MKGKEMNVKKLCRRENNANHEEYWGGIHLHRIQCLPLYFLSGSAPGNIRWCPSLDLGILFKTTSDPQSGSFFQIWLDPLFCPALFASALGAEVVHLMT